MAKRFDVVGVDYAGIVRRIVACDVTANYYPASIEGETRRGDGSLRFVAVAAESARVGQAARELEAQRDEMAIKADDWAKGIRR